MTVICQPKSIFCVQLFTHVASNYVIIRINVHPAGWQWPKQLEKLFSNNQLDAAALTYLSILDVYISIFGFYIKNTIASISNLTQSSDLKQITLLNVIFSTQTSYKSQCCKFTWHFKLLILGFRFRNLFRQKSTELNTVISHKIKIIISLQLSEL